MSLVRLNCVKCFSVALLMLELYLLLAASFLVLIARKGKGFGNVDSS